MSDLARVAAEWHGDTPVGAVTGEVDASNVAEVGVALRGLVTNESSVLVVDLSPTTYLDSAGINLMFALGDELASRQLALRLVIDPRLFDRAHVGDHRARQAVPDLPDAGRGPERVDRRASGRRRP